MMHIRLALAFALVGLIFTSKQWLQFLNTLGPETGLSVKYIAILGVVLFLAWADPYVKFEYKNQALGALLLYIAFNIIFNYQSEWISESGSGNVEKQTPDGALYNRARHTLNLNPEWARIFSFIVVPFVVVFFGSHLLRNGQKVNIN
jgi:hypothetical protein